jgi:guanylate kinase
MSSRGQGFIISGPGGSGKTTLVDRMHQECPEMIKNISYTTRPVREGEVNGVDYFFITDQEFQQKIEADEFLEHIQLFGFQYGTSKTWIESQLSRGFSVFLIVDIEGANRIKSLNKIPSIFIRPPSLDILRERLVRRNTAPEQIEKRLARAQFEMEHADLYDYQIVNDDLNRAYEELKGIVLKFIRRNNG